MQLDVLSVFQLPAASGSQPGLYSLQEDGWLTLKELREQQRRGFSWTSTCGLFACSRPARYAVDLDSHGVEFALVKGSTKPSAWVLVADEDGRPGSVRVEPLRGHHLQPLALPTPHGLARDDRLGAWLPPNSKGGGEPLTDAQELPPSVTSCQVLLEPPLGVASPRTQLVAYAFWRSSRPGELLLAIARRDPADSKSPSPGPAKRISGANGGGTDVWRTSSEQAPLWQRFVVRVAGGFDYVSVAALPPDRAPPAAPSSPGLILPVFRAVRVLWHPQGRALALSLTDEGGRSCVAVLDGGSLEVLWYRRLDPEAGDGLLPSGAVPSQPSAAHACSMAWVPNTSLLAVIDSEGHLQLLDARGSRKAAALLCGAIKYGESSVVRLGPILGKAAPLPPGAATGISNLTAPGRRRDSGGGQFSSGGGAGPGLNGESRLHAQPPQLQAQPGFSLAFAVARSSAKGAGLGADSTPAAAGGGTPVMLAVCNGAAAALVRLHFSDEPATPTAEYGRSRLEHGSGGVLVAASGGGGGGGGGSPFTQLFKSADKADDSPERDVVPALRPMGLHVQVESMDSMPSFGHSAVSTPYMLGLQRASAGGSPATMAATAAPLTCRSNTSDHAPPPWPLRWRTVLTLPPPGGVGQCAVVGVSKGGGCGGGPPSSIAASSVTAASKQERGGGPTAGGWGVFPSPAASTANLLDPSLDGGRGLHETASSAAGDAAPLSGGADGGGGGGNREDHGAHGSGGGAGPAAELPLLCTAPGPQLALHQGDVLVLRGSMAEALQHYPRAHVYGFLPAFLVLIHLHRIDAAARLLRAYAHFTGQVAVACNGGSGEARAAAASAAAPAAAASPHSPHVPDPSPAALSQQWQATMTGILDGAFAEHATTSVGGAPGASAGAGAGGAGPAPWGGGAGRHSSISEAPLKWQNSLQQVQEHPAASETGEPEGEGEGDGADGGAGAREPGLARGAADSPAAAVARGGIPTPGPMASVPEAAVLGHGRPARRASAAPASVFTGSTPDVAAGCGGGATTAAAPDAPPSSSPSPTGAEAACFASPSPSAALREMLRVCLQLLLLACHTMAFVAFSAHSAGRAVAAAAAADLLALSMSPASPRSPGGGVLSRQAMRRLSSTVRMRSLKTRSVSMFGTALLGASPSGHYLVASNSVTGGAGASAGAGPFAMRADRSPSRHATAAASMLIGFPIPVVWQPLPNSQLPPPPSSSFSAPGGGGGALTLSQLAGGQHAPVSGASVQPRHAGALGGGAAAEALASFAASAAVAASHSPPGSPPPRQQHQQQPASGAMRLQLHHCAFDLTRLWQDAAAQQLPLGQSAASVYLKPSYAAGLLLMAHACNVQLQLLSQHHHHHPFRKPDGERQDQEPLCSTANGGDYQDKLHPQRPEQQQHPHATAGVLRLGGGGVGGGGGFAATVGVGRAARVNWQLLRATAGATHAAAVWQQLNDWHRAALLVFACANALTQQGGGTEDLPLPAPRQRRASDAGLGTRSAGAAAAVVPPQEDRQSGAKTGAESSGGQEARSGGGCSILAAARASCLRMGQRVLLLQVGACQRMEVQDACGVMLELVALPRRLLGLQSAVHVSLLQKVCTRVVDLLPARVSITPLLPAGAVPPLLQLSHAGIRAQLVAHCGGAVARVLEELRLAAACGGGFVSLRDAVQQIADHSTVDSCVRMLLRWQGSYDGARVDAAAARLAENVQDATLLPDASEWNPDAVLPSLQDAFVTSGLLTIPDATAVIKAARAAAAAATDGAPQLEEPPAAAGAPADASRGLQDLDELALLLDLTQLQHTLLASLQPFLHDALLVLRGPGGAPADRPNSTGLSAGGSGGGGAGAALAGEEEHEEELADSSVLAALPPVELAVSCLKLLLKLQWAMHCRAQVCALMLRLVQLQAQPPPLSPAISAAAPAPAAPTYPSTTANLTHAGPAGGAATPAGALCGSAAAAAAIGGGAEAAAAAAPQLGNHNQPHRQPHPPVLHRPPSQSNGQVLTSPRSFSHASVGHRSFRDYIQHMATSGTSSGNPALSPSQSVDLLPQAQSSQQSQPQPALQQAQRELHDQQRPGAEAAVAAGGQALGRGGGEGGGRGREGAGAECSAGCVPPLSPPPPPPPPPPDPAAELEAVQSSLMAWTAALVRADVFHSSGELQGCVLTVLAVVKSCPLVLVTALNRALERREILNKALAEQMRRLRSAPPPATLSLQQPQPQPAPATPTLATASAFAAAASGGTGTLDAPARAESWFLPGGAMAPAPSFAMAPAPSFAMQHAGSSADPDTAGPAGLDAPGSPPPPEQISAVRLGSLALPEPPVARAASAVPRALGPAEAGLSVVVEGLDDGGDGNAPSATAPAGDRATPRAATSAAPAAAAATPATVPAANLSIRCPPAAPAASQPGSSAASASGAASQVHPMQLAVAAAHSGIRTASLTLLEYYADPSGALPSGLSLASSGDLGSGAGADAPKSSCGDAAGGGRTPFTAAAAACGGGNGGGAHQRKAGGQQQQQQRRQRPRYMLARSQTVSRSTPHSTLLQCLVCELVRTAHSVTASVSWKATLEGGRGLAGCFVHPILHGGSSAAAAAAAAAEGSAAASAATKLQSASSGSAKLQPASSSEEVMGLGAVPGFLPGAEGAQALLLSLLDVRQWGAELKPLPVPSGRSSSTGGGFWAVTAASFVGGDSAAAPTVEVSQAGEGEEEAMEADEDGAAEDGEEADPRVGDEEDDDPRVAVDCGDRTPRPSSPGGRSQGNTSRMSFSGLTDGDADSSCYPSHGGGGGGGGAAVAKASAAADADRHGNSSIRQHTNPAFGLHSPTPSNLSEFWDETSDLASPQSTIAGGAMTTPQAPDSRPGTAGTSADATGRLLCRAGSSPSISDATATASPHDTRAPSSGPIGITGSMSNGGAGAVASSASASPRAPPLEPRAQASTGAGCSPRQGANGGGGGGGNVTSGGDEVAATATAEPGAAQDGGDGDGEQPPTLSYLIDVQTLADIRRAVREARGDAAEAPEAAAASCLSPSSPRLGSGGGDVLSAPRSTCSLGVAPAPSGASRATSESASDVSVRGGVSMSISTLATQGPAAPLGQQPGVTAVVAPGGPLEPQGVATAVAVLRGLAESHDSGVSSKAAAGGDAQTPPPARTSPPALVLSSVADAADRGSDLTFDSPTAATVADAPSLLFGVARGAKGAVAAGVGTPAGAGGGTALRGAGPNRSAGLGLGVAPPHLHTVPRSSPPRQAQPRPAAAASAAAAAPSTSFGGRRDAPPPSPLPLADFYHTGLGAGLSLNLSPSPIQGQSQAQAQAGGGGGGGASSPGACSIASSISLASPRLTTAGSSASASAGGAAPALAVGLGQGSGGGGGAAQQETPFLDGLAPLQQQLQQHADARSAGGAAGGFVSRLPHPQQQQHLLPQEHCHRPHAQLRSPQLSFSAGAPGARGTLARSASASASASPSSARSIPRGPPPPAPSPGVGAAPTTTPPPPTMTRSVALDGQISAVSSPSASTAITPIGSGIQLQDFLREPSTGSSASPWGLASEFYATPESQSLRSSLTTVTMATSAGPAAGLGLGPDPTSSLGGGQESATPAASTSTSTTVSPAAADPRPPLPAQQPQPLLRLHFSVGAPVASRHAAAAALKRTSAETGSGSGAGGGHGTGTSAIHASVAGLGAPGPGSAGKQLRRGSRDSQTALWSHAASRRRPSYEAEHAAKASPRISGGGANPLFNAQAAAAVFGGGSAAEGQGVRGGGGGDTAGGAAAGAGGGAGRGPPKLQPSAKSGSFSSNRAIPGSGRGIWH